SFFFLRYLHSFPTRRSSDLPSAPGAADLAMPVKKVTVDVIIFYTADADEAMIEKLFKHANEIYAQAKIKLDKAKVEKWDHDKTRSEEHTSELQSRVDLVCRL